jgi:hypothetical protein
MARAHSFGNLQNSNEDDIPDWLDQFSDQIVKVESGRDLTIRPVGPVLVLGQHWPKIPKSGTSTPPLWCPRFDPGEQKFVQDRPCPLHEDFEEKAQKRLLFCAIVRDWQTGRRGRDNPIGIISLPGSVTADLLKIMKINRHDITDPEKGCDIMVSYDKSAAPAQKWGVQRVEATTLTDEEQAFEVPDLEASSPDFSDPEVAAEYARLMRSKMARWSYYVKPLNNGKRGWDGYKWALDGKPYTTFSELAGDKADKQDDQPRSSRRQEARARPVDDDAPVRRRPVDDDDPSPEAEPAPARQARQARDPDVEDAGDAPPPPARKPNGPRAHADWTAQYGIKWVVQADGQQPACYGDFAQEPKCRQCPLRKPCLEGETEAG